VPLTLLCHGALSGHSVAPTHRPSRAPEGRLGRLLAKTGPPERLRAPIAPNAVYSQESGVEYWLRKRFNLGARESVAASAAFARQPFPQEAALILRPVHLHAARDHLVLWPSSQLSILEDEEQSLFESAQDWLKDEPIRLRRLSTGIWELVETDPDATRFEQLQGASSARAAGRNIDYWLPSGTGGRAWRRVMNEVQMLWHDHPVNSKRAERGEPPVNALWLEGVAPRSPSRAFDVVVSDDPVLIGLATATGARQLPLANHDISSARQASDRWLVDLPSFFDASGSAIQGHADGYWAQLERFVETQLNGGFRALTPGSEIILTGEEQVCCFTLQTHSVWRFWRKRPRLSWLAEPSATTDDQNSRSP
jgi:hypothetical protein